jgi:hypothetical protein
MATASIFRTFGLILAAIACAAMPAKFDCSPGVGRARAQVGAAPPALEIAVQEGPFRRVAEEFVMAAATGDRLKAALATWVVLARSSVHCGRADHGP